MTGTPLDFDLAPCTCWKDPNVRGCGMDDRHTIGPGSPMSTNVRGCGIMGVATHKTLTNTPTAAVISIILASTLKSLWITLNTAS